MYTRGLFPLLASLSPTQALKLLASSYGPSYGLAGSMQTLSLSSGSNSTLSVTSTNQDCGSNPSWLEVSTDKKTILCTNEADPAGSVTLLSADKNGKLKKLSNATTVAGGVSSVVFGRADTQAVALAHYNPPAISTFSMSNNGMVALQNFTFPANNSNPAVPDRQEKSHIHQALLDPFGQYILFPDLGSDQVRVYCIDGATNALTAHTSLQSKRGYGPRHAAFWQPREQPWLVYLFVLHELSNKIVSYNVTYLDAGGLEFNEVDEVSMFGDKQIPKDAGAAEILVSPDNNFILASNRLAPIFDLPNPDARNSTKVKSDSIVTFKPTAAGKLEFVELVASGGLNPRHFSMNKDGSKVAVANGGSGNVVVYSRNVASGKMGPVVAAGYGLGAGPAGALTAVQWLEE
jgi:6-phosphogluconolactonase (cycloisomerase 2 family)